MGVLIFLYSFHVLKRSGREDGDVRREMLHVIADWTGALS